MARSAASGGSRGRRQAQPKPAPATEPEGPEIESEVVGAPALGRIIHFNIGVVDPVWRSGLVVEFDRFGERHEDWRAIIQLFISPTDRSFPAGARVWSVGALNFAQVSMDNHGEHIGAWRWPPIH